MTMLSAAAASIRLNISSPTTPWPDAQAGQQERELARLGQRRLRPGSPSARVPQAFDRPAMSAALTGTIRMTAMPRARRRRPRTRVDEHSDRHEEDASEHVAQRTELARDLVADVRLADEQSGQERAQCERQAEQLADIRRAECDGYDGQDEDLAAAQQSDTLEEPRQHLQAERQQDREEDRRLARDRHVDAQVTAL